MNRATAHYSITIDNFVSGRIVGCDKFLHPKGRAVDIASVKDLRTGKKTNFTVGSKGDNKTVDRQFLAYMATLLPRGSEVGQIDCAGRKNMRFPAGVSGFRGDLCNHQHIDLGK